MAELRADCRELKLWGCMGDFCTREFVREFIGGVDEACSSLHVPPGDDDTHTLYFITVDLVLGSIKIYPAARGGIGNAPHRSAKEGTTSPSKPCLSPTARGF